MVSEKWFSKRIKSLGSENKLPGLKPRPCHLRDWCCNISQPQKTATLPGGNLGDTTLAKKPKLTSPRPRHANTMRLQIPCTEDSARNA